MADYIGARYTIKVYQNSLVPSSAEWESGFAYEPLTLVTYNNSSYLSKVDVPASVGSPDANPTYWAITGAYNGQILQLQNDVSALQTKTNQITGKLISDGEYAVISESDGVKTIGDQLVELATQIETYVTGKKYRFILLNINAASLTPEIPQIVNGSLIDCGFNVAKVLTLSQDMILTANLSKLYPDAYISINGTISQIVSNVATNNALLFVETFTTLS